MSPLFDYFNRSNGGRGSEDEYLSAWQNERRRDVSDGQRETVDRPYCVMIVIIIGIGSN